MTEPDASQGFGVPRDLIVDAVRNLHAVRQRSALALLGIVIGTAAVIAMITIGENAKSHALAQFQAMGVDLLAIQPDSNQPGRPPPFTPGDAAALRALPGIDAVAPLTLAGMELAHDCNRVVASVAGPLLSAIGAISLVVGGPGGWRRAVREPQILFMLADLETLAVSARVDDMDVNRLHPGQPVDVTGEALPADLPRGHITAIAHQATAAASGSPAASFAIRVGRPISSVGLWAPLAASRAAPSGG